MSSIRAKDRDAVIQSLRAGVALADLRKGLRTGEQASVEVLHKILNDTTGATDLLKISKEVDQAGRSGLFYAAWHNRNLCA